MDAASLSDPSEVEGLVKCQPPGQVAWGKAILKPRATPPAVRGAVGSFTAGALVVVVEQAAKMDRRPVTATSRVRSMHFNERRNVRGWTEDCTF
jgi:hypothetical protein